MKNTRERNDNLYKEPLFRGTLCEFRSAGQFMKNSVRRTLAVLLSIVLALSLVPVSAFAQSTGAMNFTDSEKGNTSQLSVPASRNAASSSNLVVDVSSDKDSYAIGEDIIFTLKVKNTGNSTLENVILKNRSHMHISFPSELKTIEIGALAAKQSKTVTVTATYRAEPNTTFASYYFLKATMPVFEAFLTLYCTLIVPFFVNNAGVKFVYIESTERDYAFLSLAYNSTSDYIETTTEEPTEPTTEPTEPTTEPTEPTTEPTEPTTDPTEPTTDPTEPTTEPTTDPAELITLNITQTDFTTTENVANLSGTFSCENFDNIRYEVAPFFYETGSSVSGEVVIDGLNWESSIPLKPGDNKITFTVYDIFGNYATVNITVTYNIGETYTYTDADITFDEAENVRYVNNIITVYFDDGTSNMEIDDIVRAINGDYAGVNYALNCYQIRIDATDLAGLNAIIEQLYDYSCVLLADYDEMHTIDNVSVNDPWAGDVDEEDWLDEDADGSNWGLEAIQAAGAWEKSDRFSTVRIGVVDNGFTTSNADLDLNILSRENSVDVNCDHGTHVSGIIGATANNGMGMTGIMYNYNNLLCYDASTAAGFSDSEIYAGLSELVSSGAKIINFSLGMGGTQSASTIKSEGARASLSMSRLLKNNDFVVVQAAGNSAVDSVNNGLFCSVTRDNCRTSGTVTKDDILNRIIVVAAAEKSNQGYEMCNFSNSGSTTTIAAPGRDIYSTVLNSFESWDGTSMAAPIVTAVAGLVWSVNDAFSGAEVKDIVCSATDTIVADNPDSYNATGSEYMVNAKLAVEEAINRTDGTGTMKVRFLDSVTGTAVCDVTITCTEYTGFSQTNPVNDFVYSSDTRFNLTLDAGIYVYKVTHDDYIERYITFEIRAGEVTELGDITIAKAIAANKVQIILNWGASPSDLDSHFTGIRTDGGVSHVYYASMGDYNSAWLDTDDTSSYGPETITLDLTKFSSFTYSVHNYSDKNATNTDSNALKLATSSAKIDVVRGNIVIATYIIPANRKGTVWNVFNMDSNGVITDINSFDFISSPEDVGSDIS